MLGSSTPDLPLPSPPTRSSLSPKLTALCPILGVSRVAYFVHAQLEKAGTKELAPALFTEKIRKKAKIWKIRWKDNTAQKKRKVE